MRIALMCFALLANFATAATAQSIILDVQNMRCATCPLTVKKVLQKVPGVSAVSIDYPRKMALLLLDGTRATGDTVIKALADAGIPLNDQKVTND